MAKLFFSSKFIFLFAIFFCLLVFPQGAKAFVFERDLSLGSRGEDVRELQKWLNTDTRTQVAPFGPGSPSFETDYFGSRTAAAVKIFQEINRDKILSPLGLFSGTGYVGSVTRGVFNASIESPTDGSPVLSEADTPSPEVQIPPNEENLDEYIKMVREQGKMQGYSEGDLRKTEEEIRKIVATTTDLKKYFFDQAQDSLSSASPKKDARTLSGAIFGIVEPFLSIFTNTAHAQSVLRDLGGRVLVTIPCTCVGGAVWSVAVGPPRPVLADYVIGTQLHLYYNFPFPQGIWALGKYTSTGSAICLIGAPPGCTTLPSQGIITPILGTSLSPGL